MVVERKEKGSGNFLSFLLSGVFFAVVGFVFHQVFEAEIAQISLNDISWFEFFILTLAVFRLQRLLVYDTVSQWIRDFFLITREDHDKATGVTYVIRAKHQGGMMRLFADLLSCPWCVGVWAAAATVITYYMFPWTWPFWLLMAIAGASSFIQLTVNLIGWKAEGSKIVVERDGGERE